MSVEQAHEAAERTLTGLEPLIADAVDAALAELARLIAAEAARLPDADDVDDSGQGEVSADGRGVLARIRGWWNGLLDWIFPPALAVYEAAATRQAQVWASFTPADIVELPSVFIDDPDALPTRVQAYLKTARNRLVGVGDSLWETARAALVEGEANGDSPDELADRLMRAFAADGAALGEVRARRIARTETMAAWNRAALDQARELPEGDRPTTKSWLATLDLRVRPTHFEADGQTVALDGLFSVGRALMAHPGDPTAPPEEVINCFPGDTLVTVPSGLRRVFRRWYEGPLIEVHTQDGGKLAGTPNHPLLADTGWKPLHLIEVGDQLIGAAFGEGVGVGDPHVEDRPATLGQLYRAARESGVAARVVRGGVDFHGDVADGEVEIVGADGGLSAQRDAPGVQSGDDVPFDRPGRRMGDLPGPGDAARGLEPARAAGGGRAAVAAAGGVGGGGQGRAFGERHARHAQPVGGAAVAQFDASGGETVRDRPAGDAESLGEGEHGGALCVATDEVGLIDVESAFARRPVGRAGSSDLHSGVDQRGPDAGEVGVAAPSQVRQRLAGAVALHEVSGIKRRWFRGHVYNLETEDGWYIANGIGAHNCRCVLTTGDGEVDPDAGRQFLSDAEIERVIRHYEEQGIVREAQASAAGGTNGGPQISAAAEHTGAMIALVPGPGDAELLSLAGGEPPEELHVTLYYLGDGDDFSDQAREDLVSAVAAYTGGLGPVEAQAFAASAFNPDGDETALVLGLGGDGLTHVHNAVLQAVADYGADDLPAQHEPWVAHMTLAYSDDLGRLGEVAERTGPVTLTHVRIAFAGEVTDLPLIVEDDAAAADTAAADVSDAGGGGGGGAVRRWGTPDDTALAYEDTQTGDGRVFAPGALFWEDGPWPLQYAEQMLGAHQGARLAGSIEEMDRDADRITGAGVLYSDTGAGREAIGYLERGAPLGVSVDLDDVDMELVDRRPAERREDEDGDGVVLLASLAHASFLRLPDGTWAVSATQRVEWTTGEAAVVSAAGLPAALTAAGLPVTHPAAQEKGRAASAGDPDTPGEGEVIMAESSGDYLMRVTRGRVRGATLVSMPAYHKARIVLTDTSTDTGTDTGGGGEVEASAGCTACGTSTVHRDVVGYVAASPVPVTAADVADALSITVAAARGHLARAAAAGRITRVGRGLYSGAPSLPEGTAGDITAAVTGDTGLPVHSDRDADWDGGAAASRVLDWATGTDGEVDPERLARAFLWRDDDADPATLAAYKLGFADISDGDPVIIARGVFAVAAALSGARGGVDVSDGDRDRLRDRTEDLYERLADAYDDPSLRAPWDDDHDRDDDRDDDGDEGGRMAELEASAWTAMRDAAPMPAGWFAEPTDAELPPGSGGVHYDGGRIFGWVAQAGEPHAGFPRRNITIESLGDVDLTHFLRARFTLDDGSTVRAGAFTMNAPHNRDGAECETAACQFDDTRTVAGIVTVGINERGMWFAGAAAPWLSEWDRQVFNACQPSYHMRQGRGGRWQLRAVLSVPVPGHSSPLIASAVAERANLALAASAHQAQHDEQPPGEPAPAGGGGVVGGVDVAALAAALVPALAPAVADELEERDRIRAEVDALAASLSPARADLAASLAAQVRTTPPSTETAGQAAGSATT